MNTKPSHLLEEKNHAAFVFSSPRRMLEAGGVTNELRGLDGVTGKDGLPAEGHGRSTLSVSLPRLLDGRLSF